jgi:putative intracellular protease/amidase
MWDLPDNAALTQIAARIYQRGGVVAAVCHGPAGLVNVKLDSGRYLVDGKDVAAFTNDEEREVKLDAAVPFFLADRLKERGARHHPAANWQPKVVVSERLVTGQNPASATGVGEAIAKLLGAA